MDITFHMIPHKSMLVKGFGQLDSSNYQDSLLQPYINSPMSISVQAEIFLLPDPTFL